MDSLIDQDLLKSDYEIICINDGSTDGSLDVLKKYEKLYSNIIIKNLSNGGVCKARNTGLESAQGEYVWFIDSDDFIQGSVLGKLKSITKQTGCDMLTIGCYKFFETLSYEEKKLKNEGKTKENMFGNDASSVLHLFRTAFLHNNNLSFIHPELKYFEDSVFICEVKLAKPVRKMAKDIIYFYRRNRNSTTMRKEISIKTKLESSLVTSRIMKEYYDNGNREEYVANLWMSALWTGLQQLSLMEEEDIKRELRRLKAHNQWPVQRPPECTLKKSYMSSRSDLYGKLVDWIYMHSHTVKGFMILRLFNALRSFVKR